MDSTTYMVLAHRIDWKNPGERLDNHGQVIVGECHQVSAFSFEAILKQTEAAPNHLALLTRS